MAIDIRATVTCSLGTLISASISDDYVQGTGLIKCKGNCELSGIYTPSVGDEVTFQYTKAGVTRDIPRKLRVLSSFADPFRRTTQVELGCKLTYLQDLQEAVDWTAFDDIANNEFTVDDQAIVTVPISAMSVLDECLGQLGITATCSDVYTPDPLIEIVDPYIVPYTNIDVIVLTSSFSIAQFDLSPGYVQVISDLLISESYCGYLNRDEVLVIFKLDREGGTGPVIDSSQIIDLGPIGIGQLPGDAVVVNYSTLELTAPDPDSQVLWEEEETVVLLEPVEIKYAGDFTGSKTYTGRQVTTTETEYETLSLATFVGISVYGGYWSSLGSYVDVVSSRTTTVTTLTPYIEGKRAAELLAAGVDYANVEIISDKTVETFTYSQTTGEQLGSEKLIYEDRKKLYSRIGVPLVFSATDYVSPSGLVLVGKEVTTTEQSGDFTKNSTQTYQWEGLTQHGSQKIAEASDALTTASDVSAFIEASINNLICTNSTISTTRQGVTNYQGRPSGTDLTNAANASGGDPNNGWKTTSTAELELAYGDATAQRRIEFTVPYPPDDIFTKYGEPPTYGYTVSDAADKANRYGRAQNALLLGNRSGMNLQLAPEVLPDAPFDPFIVEANGLSALYRNNGTSWQMSADGCLVSTDALFWGAVGTTSATYGDFWFPVAPGITTLPVAPAVVNGQMTVTNVVPVWNETVKAEARLRVGLGVTSLSYPLTLLTEPDPIIVNIGLGIRKIIKVDVPAGSVALAGAAPTVSVGAAIRPPFADIAVAGLAPAVAFGCAVQVPSVDMAVAGATPAVSATLTTVLVPIANIAVAGATPDIQAGDDYYSNLAAQVFTLLRDWRVDWWGD